MNTQKAVIIHDNDNDGYLAAVLLEKLLGCDSKLMVMSRNISPKEHMEDISEDSRVYLLDFSWDKEVILEMRKKYKFVTVIDHHKTTIANLEGVEGLYLDTTMSTSMLVWVHFGESDRHTPLSVKYVNDRDIWKHDYPESNAFSAYLYENSLRDSYYEWDKLVFEDDLVTEYVEKGFKILERHDREIEHFIANGNITRCKYKDLNLLLYPQSRYISEVGSRLLARNEDIHLTLSYFDKGDEMIFSMRSKDRFDVSSIALIMGGGGHANAAGFKTSLEKAEEGINSMELGIFNLEDFLNNGR